MTVGQLPEGVSASSVVKPFTNNNSSNSDQQIRPNQTNYLQSENSFTSSSEILEQQCEEQKMQKICHTAATTMIGKSSRFARFLADGVLSQSSSESCSHQITSSPSSSSLPVRPLKSYHHPTGHWEYGMILVVLFLLSTSSMVACVPLGQSGGGGGGRNGALPSSSSSMEEGGGLMSASRILELKPQNQNQQSDSSISYSVQPKGQLYLPSLLSKNPQNYNGRGREAVGEERGNHNNEQQQQQSRTTSHFLQRFHHPDQSTFNTGENHFQRAPIQKQNQDLVRGVIDEEENDLESGGSDDDPLSPTLGVDGDSDDSEWETVIDPHLYVLTEWNTQPYHEQFPLLQQQRKRRNSGMGPSLSIVNPLDVLRQRLLLEIARRKMRQSHNQIIANEEILRKIGRRR